MGYQPSYGAVVEIASRALEAGADRRSLAHFEWDVSGRCESPMTREISARPDFRKPRFDGLGLTAEVADALRNSGLFPKTGGHGTFLWDPGDNSMLWISLTVRCRRCRWCLLQRGKAWKIKASVEIERASRTWFATYTASPDEHFRWLCEARMACEAKSICFEHLSDADQFRARCKAAGPDITRYLKRVRKQSGATLRYLLVAERHRSGLPHWHALIHECDASAPVRKAVLKGQWPHGHSTFKLVDGNGAAWYVCKYLTKDMATRVRGSLNYGL